MLFITCFLFFKEEEVDLEMKHKIIVLGLIIGLMGMGWLNRNSFADTSETYNLKTQKVEKAGRTMKEEEKEGQKKEGEIVEAVPKEDELKAKQMSAEQMDIYEMVEEEAKEMGREQQALPDEETKIKKTQIEEAIILPTEEVKEKDEVPPLILSQDEEIKFHPSMTKVILRAGGGADYTTTHRGVSNKKYLMFEIYEMTDDKDVKNASELMTKGKKVFSQPIQTDADGSFKITYNSTNYQEGNYYLVISGRNESKGEYKILHFVRVSPLSSGIAKQRIIEVEPVKPIIKFNK